ncbi:hypothetical protein BV22DRAFT_1052673 [Leucogyrophana mollusca]|uniref:Uncharacterized protein n=1 Tax=Leucogyrophana mollusca TaxID=85980 RepID=A0ACB8AVX0_9AGAM|nr:hypothetical protein BV22DRAFT_1052673 [Leucogyrophana mollusca]
MFGDPAIYDHWYKASTTDGPNLKIHIVNLSNPDPPVLPGELQMEGISTMGQRGVRGLWRVKETGEVSEEDLERIIGEGIRGRKQRRGTSEQYLYCGVGLCYGVSGSSGAFWGTPDEGSEWNIGSTQFQISESQAVLWSIGGYSITGNQCNENNKKISKEWFQRIEWIWNSEEAM